MAPATAVVAPQTNASCQQARTAPDTNTVIWSGHCCHGDDNPKVDDYLNAGHASEGTHTLSKHTPVPTHREELLIVKFN